MSGAVVTGAFVVAATGAFYLLRDRYPDYRRMFLGMGVITGLISCILQVFPTGDARGKYTAHNQPTTSAGMEGLFIVKREHLSLSSGSQISSSSGSTILSL